MFHATTIKTGARLASATYEAYGASTSSTINTKIACVIPAIGDEAPFLILVTVLAISPAAGIPENIGVTMFTIPWPISSFLLLCFDFVISSATRAVSKDCNPTSTAITNAEGKRVTTLSTVISGNAGAGK